MRATEHMAEQERPAVGDLPIDGTLRPGPRRRRSRSRRRRFRPRVWFRRGVNVSMVGVALAVGLVSLWTVIGWHGVRSTYLDAWLAEQALHAALPGGSHSALAELERERQPAGALRAAHRDYIEEPTIDTALALLARYERTLAVLSDRDAPRSRSVAARLDPATRALRDWEAVAEPWREAAGTTMGRVLVEVGWMPEPPPARWRDVAVATHP